MNPATHQRQLDNTGPNFWNTFTLAKRSLYRQSFFNSVMLNANAELRGTNGTINEVENKQNENDNSYRHDYHGIEFTSFQEHCKENSINANIP